MKVRVISIVALASLATCFFVACGDNASGSDDMDPTNQYVKVDSYDDLPLCTKSNNGDSVYVADEHMYLFCSDGFWSEFVVSSQNEGSASSRGKLNIYVEADDTIPSLDFLYSCSYSYDGDVVFVASLNSYLKCDDYDWVEFKPAKTASSSSMGSASDTISTLSKLTSYKCDAAHEGNTVYVEDEDMTLVCDDGDWTEYVSFSSSSYRSSSSSAREYYKGNVSRDSLLGVCNASKEGEYAIDANDDINETSTDTYVCRSGLWVATTELELDTRGFPTDTVVGALKNGVWATYSSSIDNACTSAFKTDDRYTYVFTGSTWRKANALELCFSKACLPSNVGATASKGSVAYVCNGSAWKEQLFYDMTGKNFFNSSISYGTLTDSRDGKIYKTVTIDGKTWMAENLNYSDSKTTTALQLRNACYNSDEANCEMGGRFYSWTAAMNISTAYESATATAQDMDSTGICPTGWHVPDTTEWQALRTSVDADAQSLMAIGAWSYYSSVTPTNTSGFTAVPAGNGPTSDGGSKATFCSATQKGTSGYFVYMLSYSSKVLSRDYLNKSSYCSLRCVKNSGTVVPASSSSVPPVLSSSNPPILSSSDAPVLSSSDVPVSSSDMPVSSSQDTPESSSSEEDD